ncbi:hypothetical protein R1sor_022180 [Riccia sorocarpa]|uniref:Radical SAM core domain-containing protein n=1 Tax=Riccia sorocarpa TaxID=122646 RepID=A0ABD3GND6_9MARC
MAALELRCFVTRAAWNINRLGNFTARLGCTPLHRRLAPFQKLRYTDELGSFSDSVRGWHSVSFSVSSTARASAGTADILADTEEKCVLRNLSYQHLEAWVESIGYRKTQALMLWKYLYGHGNWAATVDEMTGLSREFKSVLKERAELEVLKVMTVHKAADGTRKIVSAVDGGTIETVVIPFATGKGRNTVCVSSQVGCAMNCQFCYTGRMGLKRNLTTAEIVEQLVIACRLTADMGGVTNVVFMGMGEPLHNADNVIRAANIMVDEHGFHLSHNKVTVSTSGLVPELRRFCRESKCCVAVSLNATTDEVRNWIMPINRKYNLSSLLGALREEQALRPNSHFLFEYVMLAGVNDSFEDAERLVELVQGIRCKINLICFNPHSESVFRPSSLEQILLFKDRVESAGLVVRIRRSRGDDQMAACGQLGSLGAEQPPRMRVPERFQGAVAAL